MGKMAWNKKGDFSSFLTGNVVYILLTVVFLIFLLAVISQSRNGAGVWEDYYAKEIARAVDLAKPGDEVSMDIHYATVIAQKNEFTDFQRMVRFDNAAHEVIVQLRALGNSHFSYFNDVNITDARVEIGVPTNVLKFKVISRDEKGEEK